jgi:hypothetical protein
MSLFTAAMGGAGESLSNMATTWIREDSAANLSRLNANLDKEKARLINELRMKADTAEINQRTAAEQSLIDYKLSPAVVDAEAGRAGKIKRAEGDNTMREVSPGTEVWRGGEKVGTSAVPTPAQVIDSQVRAGFRRPVGGGRTPDPQKRSDFDKMFDPKRFSDESGAVDYGRMALHKGLAEKLFESSGDPSGAFALAGDAITRATATAQAAAKDDPAKFKPTFEAELKRLATKAGVTMPRSVFDEMEPATAAAADDGGAARRAEEMRIRTRDAERRTAENNRQMNLTPAERRAELVKEQEARAAVEGEANVARGRAQNQTPAARDPELEALTVERIKRMSPEAARAAYKRFYADLTLEQRRALNGRM